MTRRLVDNPGDKEQIEKAKLSKQEERKQELEDIRGVLATVNGRRVFGRMARQSRLFDAITGNEESLVWWSGYRAIVQMFFKDALEASPMEFAKMLAEWSDKERGK